MSDQFPPPPVSVVSPNFSRHRSVTKSAVRSRGGVVVSQNRVAAEIGARVLKAGGHAVDAAVATAMAVGVAEPWMSGIGGVGAMLVRDAGSGRVSAFDFGGVSPAALDVSAFRLVEGRDGDLFGWPAVEGNINVKGAKAIVVPSQPAGLALAHRRFGRQRWGDLLEPAAMLAEAGPVIDWHTTLIVATALAHLLADPGSAARFTRAGAPPVPPAPTDAAPVARLPAKALAATLRTIAADGARALYEGPLAASVARDVKALGGWLSESDLAACAPREVEPLTTAYRGRTIHGIPGLTGGPTVATAFASLPPETPDDDAGLFAGYANALDVAWRRRFDTMGHRGENAPTCTTHISVIDRDGNAVSLTQTLLSLFGARVILPESGILMNNGINWFDPRPGAPNRIAPAARVLSNYCPTIMTGSDDVLAIGGCGGRKILPAVFQLCALVADRGLDIEEAFNRPRIDHSGGNHVVADERLPTAVRERLARDRPVIAARTTTYPYPFTIAGAVRRQAGINVGMSEPEQPWSDAVSEEEV